MGIRVGDGDKLSRYVRDVKVARRKPRVTVVGYKGTLSHWPTRTNSTYRTGTAPHDCPDAPHSEMPCLLSEGGRSRSSADRRVPQTVQGLYRCRRGTDERRCMN